jgi:hypothetical protein
VGSGGVIEITYATAVDLAGTVFPVVAPAPPLSPVLTQDGSASSPPLPPLETAPQCGFPPVAVDDVYSASQDTPLVVGAPGLLANDTGATPLATTLETKSTAQGGTVDIGPDGSFTYAPPSGFTGSDSFDYTVTNASGSDTGSVSIAVSDAAPAVVASTPSNGALDVATNANLSVTFSEPVNVAGTWFGIVCSGSGTVAAAVTGGPTTFTLDPAADFAVGESCTLTVLASQVTDQDAGDPPDNMATDFALSFGVDAAPAVVSTSPANGATEVPVDANLTIEFSEPVDVTGDWFEIACTVSGLRNVAATLVTGGPTLFTIDPNVDFAGVETCTATVFAAQVADQDAGDPPDTLAANHVFAFGTPDTPPTAVDDAATVNEDSGANALDVRANDTDPDGGPMTITAAGDPANGTVAITGGGSGLTYAPDPNYCNAPPATSLDRFTYTLNGGSTATTAPPGSTTPPPWPRTRPPAPSTSWPTTPTWTAGRRRSPRWATPRTAPRSSPAAAPASPTLPTRTTATPPRGRRSRPSPTP